MAMKLSNCSSESDSWGVGSGEWGVGSGEWEVDVDRGVGYLKNILSKRMSQWNIRNNESIAKINKNTK